ncbi:MAG: hypothetical protein JNL74_19735 [Fibrobacteres bacterium]|nr:hypothetical protein [Fibrobacterota bacterium]
MIQNMKKTLLGVMVFLIAGCGNESVNNSANRNPDIVSFTTTASKLGLGQSAILKCSATDPDGDPLSYTWESSDGGPLDPVNAAGNEVVYTTHSCCGGITEIIVTVKDNRGGNSKTGMLIEFSASFNETGE